MEAILIIYGKSKIYIGIEKEKRELFIPYVSLRKRCSNVSMSFKDLHGWSCERD